mmetsp:Transcript_83827/g.236943  ORF Transcript_83827/g.236943 Transcript_83827/m.236943 type:complete len:411 (+) Transcript_83827:1369-2601(+)
MGLSESNLVSAAVTDAAGTGTDGSGWRWTSYAEAVARADNLQRGVKRLLWNVQYFAGGSNDHQGQRFIGLLSENRPEWYIGDMACILGGFASAGLHTSWSQSQLVLTLTRVNLSVIVVSPPHLKLVMAAIDELDAAGASGQTPLVVVMESLKGAGRAPVVGGSYQSLHRSVIEMAEVEKLGVPPLSAEESQLDDAAETHRPGSGTESLYSLVFTSGTTGHSKAAMFEEGRFLRDISTGSTTQAVVMASFTPCSLMADRLGFYGSMLVGGRTGFVPNNLEVMPAIRSLRVTALSAPPLLWNTIHNEYARQRERMVAEEGGRQQADVEAIENKLRIEFREKLGDRCSTVGTGEWGEVMVSDARPSLRIGRHAPLTVTSFHSRGSAMQQSNPELDEGDLWGRRRSCRRELRLH